MTFFRMAELDGTEATAARDDSDVSSSAVDVWSELITDYSVHVLMQSLR